MYLEFINAEDLGDLLDVSAATIGSWRRHNELPSKRDGRKFIYPLKECVHWYAEWTASRKDSTNNPDVLSLAEARQRRETEAGEKLALQNQQTRGELIPLAAVTNIVDGALQMVISALAAIPAELQRQAPHLSATDLDIVRKVIARVLNALADTTVTPADLGLEEMK